MSWPEHIIGKVAHKRRGKTTHAFGYSVDFVLIDPDERAGPLCFSRNKLNFMSVDDRRHFGRSDGINGPAAARDILKNSGVSAISKLRLLTQPSVFGMWFNPVSFWLAYQDEHLIAVIAEVSNTFGGRHVYLCHRPGFSPIGPDDFIETKKVFYVSPFQDISGSYKFWFDVTDDRIAIKIILEDGDEGLLASITGTRRKLTNRAILGSVMKRPFGPLLTLSRIYWNALRLKIKGVRYRPYQRNEEKR